MRGFFIALKIKQLENNLKKYENLFCSLKIGFYICETKQK